MVFLRKSTEVTLVIGPFRDDTDGSTPETALVIPAADVRLWKHGAAAWAAKAEATAPVHAENGWYRIALGAADVDTAGPLMVAIAAAGALSVWREFMVLSYDSYEALVNGISIPNFTAEAD
jgi:hypothetical protein